LVGDLGCGGANGFCFDTRPIVAEGPTDGSDVRRIVLRRLIPDSIRSVTAASTKPATITVDSKHRVSALLCLPSTSRACYVFAHGAGAGMKHSLMESITVELAARGIATLRYQFPYMESGSRRPDPPALCHATVRAAVSEAAKLAPGLSLLAGGRSFGGRMTSQAQAETPLPGVVGLVFMGFPLHPAGRPSVERAEHPPPGSGQKHGRLLPLSIGRAARPREPFPCKARNFCLLHCTKARTRPGEQ